PAPKPARANNRATRCRSASGGVLTGGDPGSAGAAFRTSVTSPSPTSPQSPSGGPSLPLWQPLARPRYSGVPKRADGPVSGTIRGRARRAVRAELLHGPDGEASLVYGPGRVPHLGEVPTDVEAVGADGDGVRTF